MKIVQPVPGWCTFYFVPRVSHGVIAVGAFQAPIVNFLIFLNKRPEAILLTALMNEIATGLTNAQIPQDLRNDGYLGIA